MTDEELLESIRALLKYGHLKIYEPTEVQETVIDLKKSWLFYDRIPKEFLKQRYQDSRNDIYGEEWFLISEQCFGSEYTDNLMDMGVFILTIDDLPKIAEELKKIKIEK